MKKTKTLIDKTAMSECIKNGIFVYPVYRNRMWYLEVKIKGRKKPVRYDKEISKSMILTGKVLEGPALKVYEHWYEKLLK